MQSLQEVQFIPATGQPEYAVVPYAVYLALKERGELGSTPPIPHTIPSGENRIKAWRKALGLSQAALASRAGISIPYLSQLEHNVRVGSKDVLKRLAQALEVKIDQII